MTFTHTPKPRYSHHRNYLRQADRPHLPYLGPYEDHIKSAFLDAYRPVAMIFMTPAFHQELGAAMAIGFGAAIVVVNSYLSSAAERLSRGLSGAVRPVTGVGAAMGRVTALGGAEGVQKARSATAVTPSTTRRPVAPFPRLTITPRTFTNTPASANQLAAAQSLTLNMVENVTASQQVVIRSILSQAISKGINADTTGERLANVVGLSERWQGAVDRLFNNMLENGISYNVALGRARDYADSLLSLRGETIARTELMRAMNTGRWVGWHDLADKGQISGELSVKTWISAPGACPECDYLGDPWGTGEPTAVIGVDTPFETEWGNIVMPPGHPNCRCTINIEVVRPEEAPEDFAFTKPDEGDVYEMADPDAAPLIDAMDANG